jgi:hypothetical protein
MEWWGREAETGRNGFTSFPFFLGPHPFIHYSIIPPFRRFGSYPLWQNPLKKGL